MELHLAKNAGFDSACSAAVLGSSHGWLHHDQRDSLSLLRRDVLTAFRVDYSCDPGLDRVFRSSRALR
jgi:hypothetical protein